MAYGYKEVTHRERPGHIILVLVTILSLLVTVCVSVLLGWYVAECRSLEEDEQMNNTVQEAEQAKDSKITVRKNVTDDELGIVAQALWDKDRFRLQEHHYAIHAQVRLNKTSNKVDHAPDSFFHKVDIDLHGRSATYRTFMNLLNNFERSTRLLDEMTPEKREEIDLFLEEVVATDVMKALQYFLAEKGLITHNTTATMRETLFTIWFEPYSRSPKYNTTDSSGFEHVFVGEIRGSKAMGMHSWIQVHQQELTGDWNYMGYLGYSAEHRVYNVQFRWDGNLKKQCSFFVGTSPEFDMAIYTMCFLSRKGSGDCTFTLNNDHMTIQTYGVRHSPSLQIGTAFVSEE